MSKAIILTGSENKTDFVRAIGLGCCGIVLKETATTEIAGCIRSVYAGRIWVDRLATSVVSPAFGSRIVELTGTPSNNGGELPSFSRREREVLGLVAQGCTNPEIAERLFVSPQTIKNHLHRMYNKIGRRDRVELALHAIHSGLDRVGQTKDITGPRIRRPTK